MTFSIETGSGGGYPREGLPNYIEFEYKYIVTDIKYTFIYGMRHYPCDNDITNIILELKIKRYHD